MTLRRDDVDSRKAWVVLAASTLGLVLLGSVVYANGIIHPVLVQQFHVQDSLAAAVGGVNYGLFTFVGPLAGLVAVRWSCRCCVAVGAVLLTGGLVASHFVHSVPLLIFTYSCIAGSGEAFLMNALVAAAGHYFDKYRALAAGINVSGMSVGMLVSGPLSQFLLDSYGLHGMFLIMGAVSLNLVPIIMLMGRTPVERRLQKKCSDLVINVIPDLDAETLRRPPQKRAEDTGCVGRYVKNKSFVLYFWSVFFWSLGEAVTLIYLKSFVMARGTSPVDAANLFLAAGTGGAVSKIVVGFAASDKLVGPWVLHFSMLGTMALLTLTCPLYAESYAAQVIYAVCYGLFITSLNSLMTPISSALVGVAHLGPAFGTECMAAGAGALLAPPLAGLTTNFDPGYATTFYIAGSSYTVSSFLGVLMYKFAPRTRVGKRGDTLQSQDSCADAATEKMLGLPHSGNQGDVANGDSGVLDGGDYSSQTSVNGHKIRSTDCHQKGVEESLPPSTKHTSSTV